MAVRELQVLACVLAAVCLRDDVVETRGPRVLRVEVGVDGELAELAGPVVAVVDREPELVGHPELAAVSSLPAFRAGGRAAQGRSVLTSAVVDEPCAARAASG